MFGGSSSVFNSELAACSLARSTLVNHKDAGNSPFSGLNGARFSAGPHLLNGNWRIGPSGGM